MYKLLTIVVTCDVQLYHINTLLIGTILPVITYIILLFITTVLTSLSSN